MEHFGFPIEVIVIFFAAIGLSVYLDLRTHRAATEISLRDATLWSAFWILLALCFYGYLFFRFDSHWANLYLSGYILEKTLSVDNLMVFIAVFASLGIKGALQHRILYWGIFGALIFRGLFVVAGTTLFLASAWVGFLFAAVVIWSAWKMQSSDGDDEEIEDYSDHWSVRLAKRLLPVFPRLNAGRFFITRRMAEDLRAADQSIALHGSQRALMYATPALLCLLAIETIDIAFAFDSVPAVIAVTQEPLLVYSAMIFAILGLRSLYFVLTALTRYLVHLEKAVIVVLYFIGAKLALQSFNHAVGDTGVHISAGGSLIFVLAVLSVGILASLVFPQRSEEETGVPENP
jgi:tellurite resistance protein TerC